MQLRCFYFRLSVNEIDFQIVKTPLLQFLTLDLTCLLSLSAFAASLWWDFTVPLQVY